MKPLSILILCSWLIASCGSQSEEKKDEACEGCVGEVKIVDSIDNLAIIDLSTASVGDKYIILPYSLGNIDNLDGSNAETLTFTVPYNNNSKNSSNAFSRELFSQDNNISYNQLMKKRGFYAKMIWGRWNPKLGKENQAIGFWNLVKEFDKINKNLSQNFFSNTNSRTSLKDNLNTQIERANQKNISNLAIKISSKLTANTCPTIDDSISIPTQDGSGDDVEIIDVTSDDEYCIVYIDEPKAETDKDKISASVKKIIQTYKNIIYRDTFPDKSGFTFKPYIVIIDTTAHGLPTGYDQLLGLYNPTISDLDEVKVPIIYMASDLDKISGFKNDESGKKSFHATLAHEIQHAVVAYYRKYANPTQSETLYLDEGLAHYMESVFGYGEEGFDEYAGTFLSVFKTGIYPFLAGSESVVTNVNAFRGAAQSLLYYLISQKGGLEFEDGTVSKGSGLDFISAIVKSKESGAKNLSNQFGTSNGDWKTVIGNYLGALVLDNTAISGVSELNQVQDVFKEITDLQETVNKVYGMRFNLYRDLIDATASTDEGYTSFDSDELNISYYQTRPAIIEIKEAGTKIEIETPDDLGTAVTVIRIK